MRVFRTSYKDKNGNKRTAQKWYIELRDHLAIVRRLPAFTDKAQSEALGRQIERLVRFKIAGETPDAQLSHWLEQIPERLRKRFAKIGLIDAERAAGGKLLSEHLADFEQFLLAKGNTKGYVDTVIARTKTVIEGCKFVMWTDMSASKAQRYLSDLRDGGNGISAQTFNFYLQSVKQFCRWMVQDRRAFENPLQHLKGLNVRTDKRRNRRALELDEVRRLLEATQAAGERFGMTGYQRAMVYQLAVETGLRAKELRSLTVDSFDFENNAVTVEATYSKNKRSATLPLRPDTSAELKNMLRGKLPNVRAFDMPYKTAKMIYKDLKDAKIDYKDNGRGIVDFHSLRHTTGSLLAASGTHPKVAQSLMRHSDINLTMNRYTHIFRGQESKAVESLPDLSLPSTQAQRAIKTGTDGENYLALNLALQDGKERMSANGSEQANRNGGVKTAESKANGRIRTDNPWFTKPELCH
jgi:integrase